MASGEVRLVEWLRRRLARGGPELLGDDAALLEESGGWAISVDQQIEGVHFPAGLDARIVGRRLVGVCLSDLAASGAEPAYGFLALALPPGYPARRLLAAVTAACAKHRLALAGGDIAGTPGVLSSSLTVLGRRPPRGRWLRRGLARPGDGLWLGGTVGESALGRSLLAAGAWPAGRTIELPRALAPSAAAARQARRAVRRHLAPVPQLELGARLARRRRVAAIDVSDGLALDLHRLCGESRVGADLEELSLPLPPGLDGWSKRLGLSTRDLTLAGGEDYVLLFTLPRGAEAPPVPGCRLIGRISGNEGVRLQTAAGALSLPPSGWDHLTRTRTDATGAGS